MENTNENNCLNVELVEFTQGVKQLSDKNCLNLNKLNKLNNIYNLNKLNTISILGNPKSKIEELFFYLYDHGDQTPEQIEKGTGIQLRTLYTYKTREKENLISKRDSNGASYNISKEKREKIDLLIKQKLRQLENLEQQKQKELTVQEKEDQFKSQLSEIIEDNKIFSVSQGFSYINFLEIKELYPKIFDRLEQSPEKTLDSLKTVINEKGYDESLRIINFEECFESKSIDGLRSKDIDKLHLIECRSSVLSDVRPQITNIKYECPSCGNLISLLQLERKIKEPSRCSCGRRGSFKELSKELIDRAKVELEDTTDLTESIQIKSISGIVTEHLTNSKEISKLNPGNEVKVLGILKTADRESQNKKLTALDLYFDILEVEPFESEIDISDFTEDEIKKYEEIGRIIKDTNSLKEVRNSFSPVIVGHEYPKDALMLKLAQSRGKNSKSNVAFFGDPGSGKSVMMEDYNKLLPGSSYLSGSGASAVGLTATVEKKDDGWILKPGVLVTTKEDAILDEFNLFHEEELPKLQEAMSQGQITINKASIHAKLKSGCGVVAGANPIKGYFDEEGDIVKQFNLPPQILNRFDLIFVMIDKSSKDQDKKIAESMLMRETKKINPKYDIETLKRFFLYIRSREDPSFSNEVIDYLSEKYSEIRLNLNSYSNMEQKTRSKQINPRFVEAVTKLSKSIAKIKLNSQVTKSDIDFVLNLLNKTYLNFLL